MTVQEFYDYITKFMTPEEALKKLLSGSLIQYEKLKFDEKGKEVHPLIVMAMAAMDMGWSFIVEKGKEGEEQKEVRGIVTGTMEYLEQWNKRKAA